MNNLTTDGIAESYKFNSTVNAVDDSSSPAFTASGLGALEIDNNTAEHTVYTTNK